MNTINKECSGFIWHSCQESCDIVIRQRGSKYDRFQIFLYFNESCLDENTKDTWTIIPQTYFEKNVILLHRNRKANTYKITRVLS